MRTALLEWDYYFDPDYIEPNPDDRWGYYSTEPLHQWARAPLPLPSTLLLWLQGRLDSLLSGLPIHSADSASENYIDDDEEALACDIAEEEEPSLREDVQLLPLRPSFDDAVPAVTASAVRWMVPWRELTRPEKAAARLLGFTFCTWHRKHPQCAWTRLCSEERTAAMHLGLTESTWDALLPVYTPAIPPTPLQCAAAHRWVATQLDCAHAVELKLRQACHHPFEREREHPDRIEPLSCEPTHPVW